MKKNENSYKKSGVNISLANKLVKHISKISKKDVENKLKKIFELNLSKLDKSRI